MPQGTNAPLSCTMRPRMPRIFPSASTAIAMLPVLIALLRRRQKMLAPVLDPFHRPAELERRRRYHRFFRIKDRLRPEAAADIGRDHADRLQIAAKQIGQRAAADMRRLRSRPYGEQIGHRLMVREHRARLHRHAAAAMLPELFLEDVRGAREGAFDVAVVQAKRRGDVRAEIAVRARRVLGGSGAAVRRPPAALRIAGSAPPPRPRRCSACRRSRPRPAGRRNTPRRAPAPVGCAATSAGLGSSSGSGSLRIGSGRSSAVMTAWTPGMASVALVSKPRSLAWACGERTKQACSVPGNFTSSTKRPRPASSAGSSSRVTRAPKCFAPIVSSPLRRRCRAGAAPRRAPP